MGGVKKGKEIWEKVFLFDLDQFLFLTETLLRAQQAEAAAGSGRRAELLLSAMGFTQDSLKSLSNCSLQ